MFPKASHEWTFPIHSHLLKTVFAMTISHQNSIVFSVNVRTGPLFVDQFGMQALSAFNGDNGSTNPGAFFLDFNRTLQSITVEMGDFGDDFDNLVLQAFDGTGGTGNLIGSATNTLPQGGNTFSFQTLSVSGDGIRSVRMIGGGNELSQ